MQLLGFIVIFYCNGFFIVASMFFFVIGAIQIRDDDDDDDDHIFYFHFPFYSLLWTETNKSVLLWLGSFDNFAQRFSFFSYFSSLFLFILGRAVD